MNITLTEREIEEIARCGAACYRKIEKMKRGDHSERTAEEALRLCNEAYGTIRKKIIESKKSTH